ncbi:MAG TPA: T9SS type A sorting domain-containing protein, partial [Bacteroidales bacterium]|nr:T9SS type A sorting domain-containing protein [Bacteroidales bacterium]
DEDPVHIYANIGNYAVMLKTTNACGIDSVTQNLAVLGTAELSENAGISIYPNPVSDYLVVTMGTGFLEKGVISVYSNTGKLVKRFPVNKNDQMVMDMSDMPKSTYIIVMQTENKLFYKKVLKIN